MSPKSPFSPPCSRLLRPKLGRASTGSERLVRGVLCDRGGLTLFRGRHGGERAPAASTWAATARGGTYSDRTPFYCESATLRATGANFDDSTRKGSPTLCLSPPGTRGLMVPTANWTAVPSPSLSFSVVKQTNKKKKTDNDGIVPRARTVRKNLPDKLPA